MSAAKHTKGPWKLETESRSPDGSDLIITDCDGGYTVASCRVGSTGVTDTDEAEANAKLIAAAPLMADVLEGLFQAACEALASPYRTANDRAIHAATSVALRAAGRSP